MDDRIPVSATHRRDEGVEAMRVLGDEGGIEHGRLARGERCIVPFDEELGDPHHRREIATGLHLMILRRDIGLAERRHLDRVLRIGEALEPAFLQRVEGDDLDPALAAAAQVMEHPRSVRPDILTEEQDHVAFLEILEPRRADGNADRRLEADRGRFVAHVRAVGQVLVAVHPRHQAVHVRCLEAGAPRRIEDHRLGIHRLERRADLGKRLVPAARNIFVGRGIVAQRMRQAAILLEVIILPVAQFAQRVLLEKIGRGAVAGQLPRGRLGAFLAEFDGVEMLGLGPGAADALEAVGLVLADEFAQRLGADAFARQDLGERTDRTPASGGPFERLDFRGVRLLLDHDRSRISPARHSGPFR